MKKEVYAVLALTVGIVLLSGFACQQKSAYHDASRASKQIADDLDQFEKAIESNHAAGQLSDDEAVALAKAVQTATAYDDAFVKQVAQVKQFDSSNLAAITQSAAQLAQQVGAIDPVLIGLKSNKAKSEFNLIMSSIQAGLSTLTITLQQLQSQPPVQKAGGDPASEIAVILMAFNALASLLVKWRSDGALSDEQLQANALSENADTRSHAQAFIDQVEGKKQ